MKSRKKTISTRGKIAMGIVIIVGAVYWLMGKVEVWMHSLGEEEEKKMK